MKEQNKKIIDLLAMGLTVKEVASALNMSKWTVTRRIKKMKKENECFNVAQLVLKLKMAV